MHERRSLDLPSHADRLLPRQLARELGAGAKVSGDAVAALYRVAAEPNHAVARRALAQWKTLVAKACGHDPQQPSAASDRLAECYRLDVRDVRPAELLFSVHSYYALLVRLVVWQWMACLDRLPRPADRFDQVQTDDQLRLCLHDFESGGLAQGSAAQAIFRNDPFSWYAAAWSEPLVRLVRQAAGSLARWQPATSTGNAQGEGGDLLTDLYQAVLPKQVRHALGEYYTPNWLAEHVLDQVGYQGDADARVLDPSCGSGRFLVAAIRRVRRRHGFPAGDCPDFPAGKMGLSPSQTLDEAALCRQILSGVVGFDLHPLAVLSARANYLIALGELGRHLGDAEIPVRLCDSVLGPHADDAEPDAFDFVVGNPPWIAWDHLPADYREATKPLWQHYGLFSLSASDARHGGGKKDLAMLMLYTSADRYLKPAGRLGMVITQTLFQTRGAGDGFRRFRIGATGPHLHVIRVDDLVDVQPFADAANWTSTIVLEKGRPTVYPVPYVKWSLPTEKSNTGKPLPRADRPYLAEPIDPDRASSPWFLRPPGLDKPITRLVGPSHYQAHLGANSGGANGVYWVELLGPAEGGVLVRNHPDRGKRAAPAVRHTVEADLLYPLLRWSDVARYRAVPSAHLLLVQDVETRKGIDEAAMSARYPRTYAYLERFRRLLTGRAAYRRYQHRAAFYSMYNVGPYTVAPIKVVWRRMDRRIRAAVVESADDPLLGRRAVVPQETCVLIAADSLDEAHYLCALMNSAIVGFLVSSHSVQSGKGFGSPGMLDYLRLRRFDPASAIHAALSAASRQAHRKTSRGEDVSDIQQQIDGLTAVLWELEESDLDAIRREEQQ